MNKPTKKILIFLIALAAIVIVGVIVMLMMPEDVEPIDSVTPSIESPPVSESFMPTSSADVGTIKQETTTEGTLYTVTMPGSLVTYSIMVGADAFAVSGNADDIMLKSTADDSDFIHITFSEGTDAAVLAPGIMDRYIKYNEFEQSGQNYIPGTEIAGETVAAGDGSTALKAWIVNTNGGALAVVIRYDVSDSDTETARLYDVLKTLKIAE